MTDLVYNEELGTQEIFNGTAQVLVKQQDPAGHAMLLHEYLTARLANSLGVPVPFGEVAKTDIEFGEGWATAIVGGTGQEFAPPSLHDVLTQEPHILAGIAALDAWVLNADRTEENLLWAPDLGLWAIDHEKAFTGDDPRLEALTAAVGAARAASAMVDLPWDPTLFAVWITMIETHGSQWAQTAVQGAIRRRLVTRANGRAYERFLIDRARVIRHLCAETYKLNGNPLDRHGMSPLGDV
ncbi:HipA family kinase [Kocuria sp. KH4]